MLNPNAEPFTLFQYFIGIGDKVSKVLDLFLFYVSVVGEGFPGRVNPSKIQAFAEQEYGLVVEWSNGLSTRPTDLLETDARRFLSILKNDVLSALRVRLSQLMRREEDSRAWSAADAILPDCVQQFRRAGKKLVKRVVVEGLPLRVSGGLLKQLLLESFDQGVYGTIIYKLNARLERREGCVLL